MKYKDWLSEWLADCVRPTVKERTYEKYEQICRLKLAPALGSFELEELSAGVLQRCIADMVPLFSACTVNIAVTVLKSSLKRAVAYGMAEREFTDGILRPRISEKKVECFTRAEQKKLEAHILKSNRPKLVGILLCLYSGLRIGELLALTWNDVDFSEGMLSVTRSCHDGWGSGHFRQIVETPKTRCSVRLIPLPKQLLGALKKAKREAGGTYIVGGEKPVPVRSYQRTFELLQKKLNIPHRGFHALRHTFATRALECGMDVKTLAEILGHKNPNVTLNRYVHSLMEYKRLMMNRLGKFLQ